MKAYSITFTLIFFLANLFASEDHTSLLKSAGDAYQTGDYAAAINSYEQLLKNEYSSAALHYNLGNAYFRKNKMGKAVLHMERAALINPRDKDIQHNLRIIKNKTEDQFETIPDFFVSRWWSTIQKTLSPTGWGIVTLLILWAGIGGLILWFRGKNRKLRKRGFLFGLILLLLSLLPLFLGLNAAKKLKNTQRAVVMVAQVNLKNAADIISENVLELHEGTSLKIIDEIGEWKKVKLSNGEEGWLEKKALEMI